MIIWDFTGWSDRDRRLYNMDRRRAEVFQWYIDNHGDPTGYYGEQLNVVRTRMQQLLDKYNVTDTTTSV